MAKICKIQLHSWFSSLLNLIIVSTFTLKYVVKQPLCQILCWFQIISDNMGQFSIIFLTPRAMFLMFSVQRILSILSLDSTFSLFAPQLCLSLGWRWCQVPCHHLKHWPKTLVCSSWAKVEDWPVHRVHNSVSSQCVVLVLLLVRNLEPTLLLTHWVHSDTIHS